MEDVEQSAIKKLLDDHSDHSRTIANEHTDAYVQNPRPGIFIAGKEEDGVGFINGVEVEADPDPETKPTDIRLRVYGVADVYGHDEDMWLIKDKLVDAATRLGLHVEIWSQTNVPQEAPTRHTWTHNRASLKGAEEFIDLYKVVTRDQLAEELYRANKQIPWPKLLRDAAILKTNVMVKRLADRGNIVKRYSPSGELLLIAANDPLALRYPAQPGGLTAISKADEHKAAARHAIFIAGAAILDLSLADDATKARDAYTVMWSHYNAMQGRVYFDQSDMVMLPEMVEAGAAFLERVQYRGLHAAEGLWAVMNAAGSFAPN